MSKDETVRKDEKQVWETPTLTFIGDVTEVVLQGGGKLSIASNDPGEPLRKPKGLENG